MCNSSFSNTLSFTALIHSLTLQRSLNGSPVPFLPRQNHLSFKIHSKHPRSDLRLLLERVAVEEEETFRITRQKYTCRVRRGGRTRWKVFNARTIVHRKSSRSGRSWSSKRQEGINSGTVAGCFWPLLLLQLLLLPVLSLSSARLIYSSLCHCLPFFCDFFFISVLLPVFCFRKRQPLIYTPSLHRAGASEGAFAFTHYCRSLCRFCVAPPVLRFFTLSLAPFVVRFFFSPSLP